MSATAMLNEPLEAAVPSEFDYRPVPMLVPVSAGFLLLSMMTFVWAELLFLPLIGTALAALALRKIRRSAGAYSGSLASLVLMAAFVAVIVGSTAMHVYSYATEVPEGYARRSFVTDISDKGFVVEDGVTGLHPDVKALDGQSIFLKGFMYPTRQTQGLKSFVLCKDSGDCCFGGQPKPSDMIYVELTGDHYVDYRPGLVAVAGTFRTQSTVDETGLQPVYRIDCERFNQAKSAY